MSVILDTHVRLWWLLGQRDLPVAARTATPRMLYRMKQGTVRPIDHADAADLKSKFNLKDD